MTRPSLALTKRAPSSASAADAATNFKMVLTTWMAPLRRIGMLSLGTQPRKKWPPIRLRDWGALRYEASLWIFRIISDDRKRMVASGWVAQ